MFPHTVPPLIHFIIFAAPHQTDSRVGEVGGISINTKSFARKWLLSIRSLFLSSSTGSCPDGPSGTGIVPNLSCTSFFDHYIIFMQFIIIHINNAQMTNNKQYNKRKNSKINYNLNWGAEMTNIHNNKGFSSGGFYHKCTIIQWVIYIQI